MIVHSQNYRQPKGEINTLPSLTVPDMAISLRDLLDNHTRGQELPQMYTPVYDESNTEPDPRTLDLVDLQERRMILSDKLKETNETLKNEAITRKQTKAKADYDELVKKAKAEATVSDA